MNDAEAIVSANGTPPRRTRTSSDSSANPGQSRTDRRRIHLVLQGKGGIGKSLAASYLVQYHRHIGKPVKAFDADPVNASLAAMPGLGAQPVALVVDDAIDVKAADQFIEMLLTYDEDVVIDSGAASFLPLSSYLIDTEIAGKAIKQGEKVVMWYLSGNRDEDMFENADDLVIERRNARNHIAFGFGIHRCLGLRLAELQLRIVWEEILQRFETIEVVDEPKRIYSNFVNGYETLPVRIPG